MFLCCSLLLCKRISICVHLWRERGGGLLIGHGCSKLGLLWLLCGPDGDDIVHPDIVDEARWASVLWDEDTGLVSETDTDVYVAGQHQFTVVHHQLSLRIFLTTCLDAFDDLLVEGLQQYAVGIGVGVSFLKFKHERQSLPFITTL